MSTRPDYYALTPELAKRFAGFAIATKEPIERSLRHLVNIRASQINGCAFCVDMHVKEAKIDGERELRLHHLAIWRESTLFSERERAALEWTELVTRLPPHGVSDEAFARAREVFGEKGLAELTFAVVAINGWNRVSIAFGVVPGSRDAEYGLTKAGLS